MNKTTEAPLQEIRLLMISDKLEKWFGQRGIAEVVSLKEVDGSIDFLSYPGILLDHDIPKQARQIVLKIRSNSRFAFIPLFQTMPIDPFTDHLTDGIMDDIRPAVEQTIIIQERLQSLEYNLNELVSSARARLFIFLFSRKRLLSPVRNWRHPSFYQYPLIEAIAIPEGQPEFWLENLEKRGLLDPSALVDRVRRCPKCGLSNPNYIDVCPHCSSIDITQASFIHCFTCGTVMPENNFLTDQHQILCPQCKTQLRHIGTDYDRPLENYSCSACHSVFPEPEIKAVCGRCEKESIPEDLNIKIFYTYELTDKAELITKSGRFIEPEALIQTLLNVNFQQFKFQLNWMLLMARRVKQEIFSIMAIKIVNLEALEADIGIIRLMELVEEFVKRFTATLRITDFATQQKPDDLWLLLPRMNADNLKIMIDRLNVFSHAPKEDKKIPVLKFSFGALTIPDQLNENDTVESILSILDDEING